MSSDEASGPPLPEHPELREIALAMEAAGASADIMDERWRTVFISTELARLNGVVPSEAGRYYGQSMIVRHLDHPLVWGTDDQTALEWWAQNVPRMRRYLDPQDPDFEAVFSLNATPAAQVEPAEHVPRAWQQKVTFPPGHVFRSSVLSDLTFLELRLNDDEGNFIGIARFVRTTLPEGLLTRLGRGDRSLFERMDRVSEPARRAAGILFADLEASGVLSRRLSSHAYFELVSGLTDLIDSSVIASQGIVGKHAGDGASALFLAADFGGSESAAARATIEAARAIRAGAAELGPADTAIAVNVGIHWGATLMIGQVTTRGRLEVTALGDQMNEAARIEAAATGGAILASKDLVERLDAPDAVAAGVDPASIVYTPIAERDGVSAKAIRDAGGIAVAEL